MCEYQSVECAFTSPVSIESSILVTCRMTCPRCCSVVTPCLLMESMCLVLPMCICTSCSSVACVLMALGMFMFVKVMSSLMSVPASLCMFPACA